MHSKLSVVITAYNEEKKIAAALESAQFADEIILVDNGSADKTVEIAKKFTKHIYHQKNDPANIDLQKNFGIEKATGDWILILDADEIISKELAEEIRVVINPPTPFTKGGNTANEELVNGFWLPRKNIIFKKWMQHSGWYPDYQLRLVRKGKGRFEKVHYHEPMHIDGSTEKLKENLIHYNYESIAQFLQRGLLVYAPNEAEEILRKGYVFDFKDAIRFPFNEFLSRYFAREGYKDGFHGLMLAFLMAVYHFAIFAYIWEKKDFKTEEKQDIVFLRDEFGKVKKELSFWFDSKRIEQETNIMKKAVLKVKRKLPI